MSRSTSHATDQSQSLDFVSNEQATRPLPRVTPFDLEAEARRLDALACALDDADSTLMIGAEENRRLLANAFALDAARGARAAHDDEPTVTAHAPHLFLVPSAELEVEPAPATVRMLVAIPPAALPPPSSVHPRIASEIVHGERQVHAHHAPRATAPPATAWQPRGTGETRVVVAIWAMALTLLALLVFLVRSA